MDDIYYEKILNRIIRGRQRIRLGDLVLFIYEPDNEILEESFAIHQEAYDKAYFAGVYVEQEIVEALVENDLWSPVDDKIAEELEPRVDNLKVEAFHNYYDKKKLIGIKRQIRAVNNQMLFHKMKRRQLDHLSCNGVANFSRQCWTISKTTRLSDGSLYDFNSYSISSVMDVLARDPISLSDMRGVARYGPWQTMWRAGKQQGNVFGKPSSGLDKNQLSLISYAQMYDNVYENPDCPKQVIIDDDDCLDGWFVVQRRKAEEEKRKRTAEDVVSNPKIAESQEVFLMAKDRQQAKDILDLNNPLGKATIDNRNRQIDEHAKNKGGNIHFKELADIKQDRVISANQAGIESTKNLSRNKR